MYWLDNNSGVPTPPNTPPVQSPVRLYFTEGGQGLPPSIPGGEWFNMVNDELLNVLSNAGVVPSKSERSQLFESIKKIAESISGFTNSPTSVTPVQFSNDQKIATTEFVQRALGNKQKVLGLNANRLLDSSEVGSFVTLFGSEPIAVALPLGSSLTPGSSFYFLRIGSPSQAFIQTSGSDKITINSSLLLGGIDLFAGDSLELVWTGTSWAAAFGSVLMKYQYDFASSLSVSGYQRLPGGLIEVRGTFLSNSTPGQAVPVTFPLSMSNVHQILITPLNPSETPSSCWFDSPSGAGFNGRCNLPGVVCHYLAKGA
ncbi:hypothetical protein ACV1D9_20230 [Aeromonas allosaccharophila]